MHRLTFLLLSLTAVPPAFAICILPPQAVADTLNLPPALVVYADPTANDIDPQGLPLSVSILSSTCPGIAAVEGDLIVLTFQSLPTTTCQITYTASNGHTTAATATITVQPSSRLFADSFERGNTSAWNS